MISDLSYFSCLRAKICRTYIAIATLLCFDIRMQQSRFLRVVTSIRHKMSQKSKTVLLSIERKLQAIRRLDKGEILRIVCAYCGVEPNTVGWRQESR